MLQVADCHVLACLVPGGILTCFGMFAACLCTVCE